MAVKVAELAVDIKVNGAEASVTGMKRVEEQGKATSAALKTAFDLFRGFVGVQSVVQLTRMAESWQSVNARIALYSKNVSDAAKVQSELTRSANETRSALTDQAALYTRIAAQASALNATSSQILAVTKLVGQANAVSGASASEAAASAQQLAQALGAGTLAGDELKSILENSPRLAQAIADGLGVGVGELKKMGSEGKLLSSEVFAALLSQSNAIANEFSRIPPTLSGAITVLTNSLTESIGSLNQQLGITRGIAEGIIGLFGDDRMQVFFGRDPRSSFNSFGNRQRGIFVANRGEVRRALEENNSFASQAMQNPLFGSGGSIGGPGFGLGTPQFRPTLTGLFTPQPSGITGGAIPAPPKPPSGTGSRMFGSRAPGMSGVRGVGGASGGIRRLDAAIAGVQTRDRIIGSSQGVGSSLADSVSLVGSTIVGQFGAMSERLASTAQSIGSTFVDALSVGISTAVQSGSLGEGFRALTGTLIGGLGRMLVDFGKQSLLASTIMKSLFDSLASFIPGGSITASLGLIGLGSVMIGLGQRAARSSFGGAGRSDGFSGGGFSIPSTVSSTGTIGLPSSVIADGRVPVSSNGASVSQATPMVVNVFSPDDATTQRFFRETLRRADARGAF